MGVAADAADADTKTVPAAIAVARRMRTGLMINTFRRCEMRSTPVAASFPPGNLWCFQPCRAEVSVGRREHRETMKKPGEHRHPPDAGRQARSARRGEAAKRCLAWFGPAQLKVHRDGDGCEPLGHRAQLLVEREHPVGEPLHVVEQHDLAHRDTPDMSGEGNRMRHDPRILRLLRSTSRSRMRTSTTWSRSPTSSARPCVRGH